MMSSTQYHSNFADILSVFTRHILSTNIILGFGQSFRKERILATITTGTHVPGPLIKTTSGLHRKTIGKHLKIAITVNSNAQIQPWPTSRALGIWETCKIQFVHDPHLFFFSESKITWKSCDGSIVSFLALIESVFACKKVLWYLSWSRDSTNVSISVVWPPEPNTDKSDTGFSHLVIVNFRLRNHWFTIFVYILKLDTFQNAPNSHFSAKFKVDFFFCHDFIFWAVILLKLLWLCFIVIRCLW